MSEIEYRGQPPVDAYGPGFFRIEDKVHEGGIFLRDQGQSLWNGWQDVDILIAEKAHFDVVFIGTGADIAAADKGFKEALEKAEVAFEVMASPAACRTYNILLSEGRRVALAAMPV